MQTLFKSHSTKFHNYQADLRSEEDYIEEGRTTAKEACTFAGVVLREFWTRESVELNPSQILGILDQIKILPMTGRTPQVVTQILWGWNMYTSLVVTYYTTYQGWIVYFTNLSHQAHYRHQDRIPFTVELDTLKSMLNHCKKYIEVKP